MKHAGRAPLYLLAIICTSSLATVSSAHAEWIYKKEEKAFGEMEAIAMAVGESSVVFVSCNSEGLKISLATPEDWSDGASSINLLSPQIVLSVDKSKPARFATRIEENGLHKMIAITDDDDVAREAANQIAAARKRIDIGIEFAGKKFHASKLSAIGAKKIKSVISTCAEEASADDGKDGKGAGSKPE